MKFCKDHWERLNESLKTSGVWAYVTEDTDLAKAIMRRGGFEPRMLGVTSILLETSKASDGRALQGDGGPSGPECPVCYCVERCPCGLRDSCHYHELADIGEAMAVRAVDLGLPLHEPGKVWDK